MAHHKYWVSQFAQMLSTDKICVERIGGRFYHFKTMEVI